MTVELFIGDVLQLTDSCTALTASSLLTRDEALFSVQLPLAAITERFA